VGYLYLSGINTPHIPIPVILHRPAYEDGTDRGFRNVGYQYSDAGEKHPKENILHIKQRQKLKINNETVVVIGRFIAILLTVLTVPFCFSTLCESRGVESRWLHFVPN
jgi:hypothetical protein